MMPRNRQNLSSECLGSIISDAETLDIVSRMRKRCRSAWLLCILYLKILPLKHLWSSDIQEVSVHQDAHKTPFIKEQNKMENDCPMTNQYIRINAHLLHDTVGGHEDSV